MALASARNCSCSSRRRSAEMSWTSATKPSTAPERVRSGMSWVRTRLDPVGYGITTSYFTSAPPSARSTCSRTVSYPVGPRTSGSERPMSASGGRANQAR